LLNVEIQRKGKIQQKTVCLRIYCFLFI